MDGPARFVSSGSPPFPFLEAPKVAVLVDTSKVATCEGEI